MNSYILSLRSRRDILGAFLTRASSFYTRVNKYMSGVNAKDKEDFSRNIEVLERFHDKLKNDSLEVQSLASLVDIYDELKNVDEAIRIIVSFYVSDIYARHVVYDMSSTYANNFYAERSEVVDISRSYMNKARELDNAVFENVLKDYSISEIVSAARARSPNKLVTKLLSHAVTHVPDARELVAILENQKDEVLSAKRKRNRTVSYRLGLTSCGAIDLADYGGASGFSAHKQSNIIAIYRDGRSPLEFSLRGLIDAEYIEGNGLMSKKTSGLTNKVLKRFATIVALEPGKSPASYTVHDNGADNWIVLETLNGKDWRQLARGKQTKFSLYEVRSFTEGESGRPAAYNNAQSAVISTHIMDPSAVVIQRKYAEQYEKLLSPFSIKGTIEKRLLAFYSSSIANNKQLTVDYVRGLLTDPRVIFDAINESLSKRTHAHSSPEYVISHVAKLESIVGLFIRTLEQQWKPNVLPSSIFKNESRDEIIKKSEYALSSTLHNAIESLDSNNTWAEYDKTLKSFYIDVKDAIL